MHLLGELVAKVLFVPVVETCHPAGIRRLVAQQDADKERNWAKSSARADELEALIADTKDSVSRSSSACVLCAVGAASFCRT